MDTLDSTALDSSHAPLASREEWRLSSVDDLSANLDPSKNLSDALRKTLARAWTDAALGAHGAVATYARFALQLMSLGAPPQLLQGCSLAMQEEVAHAQACFSLARRYATSEVGPGPVPAAALSQDGDVTAIVLEVVQRGCIAEAVSALSAREALEHCQDPAAREVLVRHHTAKAQQAQLAWRFVAWALETRPALALQVREAFAQELAGVRPGQKRASRDVAVSDGELARHGLLSPALRAALRERVLASVVAPCAEALLAGAGWERPDASLPSRTAHPA